MKSMRWALRRSADDVRQSRSDAAVGNGLQGSVAAEAAGAASMPRRAVRDLTFKGFAIPAGTMVGVNPLFTHHMAEICPIPKHSIRCASPDEAQRHRHPLCLGAVRRRRAYVPRPALRLYAGEMLCAAFPAEPQRVAGARLQAGLADVADPKPRDGLKVVLKPAG